MADKKNFEISDDELDQVAGGVAGYYGYDVIDGVVEGNGLYGVNSSTNGFPSSTESIDPNGPFIAQSNTADLHIQHKELMS